MTAKRVLLLHGYSAANRGDGLLVEESLALIRETQGDDVEIDIVTSYPASFAYTGLHTFTSKPTFRGYPFLYLRLLLSRFQGYDLVVGVGGGYLRFGTASEIVKTLLVMGPQLLVAAMCKVPTVYLPQSVGPARFGFARPLRALLSQIDCVWVRDNRSLDQFSVAGVRRASDLALLSMNRRILPFGDGLRPVVSVREHRGGVPGLARVLAHRLNSFDGYVQSAVAGNDDTAAVWSLEPESLCSFEDLIGAPARGRVVVAVRLHAALMAIDAGHYVIHLAYERKGFGAFEDLGLEDFVFNVHEFSVGEVEQRVGKLLSDPTERAAYDLRIAGATGCIAASRGQVLASLADHLRDGNVG